MAKIEPRHIVLEQKGIIVGILPCFIQYSDPFYTVQERLFGPLASFFGMIGIQTLPALLAYSPTGHQTLVFLRENINKESSVSLFTNKMDQICQEEKLLLSGWCFVSGWDTSLIKELKSKKYQPVFLAPSATWYNHFTSFGDCLTNIKQKSKSRYRSICRERKKIRDYGINVTKESLESLSSQELASMRAVSYAKYQSNSPSPFTADFFKTLKQQLKDKIHLLVARKEGELLGYVILLKGQKHWHAYSEGYKDIPEKKKLRFLFELTYYFPFEEAISEKVSYIEYGLASYEAKCMRGCILKPIYMNLKAHSFFLKIFFFFWFPVLDQWNKRKNKRFLKYYQTKPGNSHVLDTQ